ncbi:MAG: hypothetical protein Crog4KO_01630 [Crocinitomicaceae bacterium]
MLKMSLFIASFCFSLSLTAQNAVVLENTPDNQSLFDAEDPLSFISLVQANSRYLGYMELDGMSEELIQSLSSDQKAEITHFTGKPGTVPIIDDNPDSPRFGDYLLYTNPDTGQQSFVYAAPDTVKTMLTNIDRIVLTYEDGDGSVWERLETISYWNKFNGAYHEVFQVNAQDLLSFDGFSRYIKLDDDLTRKLTASDPNSLWNVMREEGLSQLEQYEGQDFNHYSYDMKHRFFPGDAIRFGFFDWSKGPANLDAWEKDREIFYSRLNDEQHNAQFPFGLDLGNGMYRDTTGKAEMLALFDAVYSDYEKPSEPLIERDPNSPNFGNYKIQTLENGEESFVYPIPKQAFFWIDYSNVQIYVAESYYSEGNAIESSLNAIYYTMDVNGTDEVISVVPMKDAFLPYFEEHESTSIQNLDFYQLLKERVADTNSHFDLNDKTDRDTLEME